MASKTALSPDGSYLYVGSDASNMVMVLDPQKLIQNQDALITTIAATDVTREIVVSPVPPPGKATASRRQQY